MGASGKGVDERKGGRDKITQRAGPGSNLDRLDSSVPTAIPQPDDEDGRPGNPQAGRRAATCRRKRRSAECRLPA